MIIGIIKETQNQETRVAITPQSIAQLRQKGFEIIIEQSAGQSAFFYDNDYQTAGAKICSSAPKILSQSDILLQIAPPKISQLHYLKKQATIITDFQNYSVNNYLPKLKQQNLNCFALNQLPRISRAQPFDILSSQSNIAGYQAVIYAANLIPKMIPMMFTSAGTIPPQKFLIIGIGVAGLQAIATAKRLGGKVYAHDPRLETKEQTESLGAIYIDNINTVIYDCDIIICSAFSPNKQAPLIIEDSILNRLHPNTILIDMATSHGGNIAHSQNDQIININNCTIYGNNNFATQLPTTASNLFAANLTNFIDYIYLPDTSSLNFNIDDEIISSTLISKG